jgi:hypothetical protein
MKRTKLLITPLVVGLFVGIAPASVAQVFNYGPAQLARQAIDIRAPYLAQMAQIKYLKSKGKLRSDSISSRKKVVPTTFVRSQISWFKPWSWANELSKKIEWNKKESAGTNFAREDSLRRVLTKLFTSCLDIYEQQTKAEGLPTNDLAVTFSHSIALNMELSTGRKITAKEDSALRKKIRDEFARSTIYWTDAGKQAIHETIVITTMLAVVGYANATQIGDKSSQAMFRETAGKNVTALTNASLGELQNARSGLSSD